ncbi:hypothetical protein LINPERHAP1_LOCUS15890 [Linum perenne]
MIFAFTNYCYSYFFLAITKAGRYISSWGICFLNVPKSNASLVVGIGGRTWIAVARFR